MSYAHWRETSNGGLGSFGPHTMIFPFMALGLRELWDDPAATIRVQAECSGLNRISFPRWERVRWEFPARGDMQPVTITWHHGPEYAPAARELVHEKLRGFGVSNAPDADSLMKNAGSMLIGSEGALVADDHAAIVGTANLDARSLRLNYETNAVVYDEAFVAEWSAKREDLLARLDAAGVACEPIRIDEYTGQRFTFFTDPDGLPLELYEQPAP